MYALILSGGRGERLKPLTDRVPKPMISVAGQPILWHQVQWLKAAGITDVVFLAGYHWQAIQEFFGDGLAHGFRAYYSIEDEPLGRGGAIRKGLATLPPDEGSVVITNGDVITKQELSAVLNTYRQSLRANDGHMATIMVVPMSSPFGVVDVDDDGKVRGFQEKVGLPYWINGGVYVFNRAMEPQLPEKGDHEISTFPAMALEDRITAYRSTAFWKGIDSFKDLREAEEQFQAFLGTQGAT